MNKLLIFIIVACVIKIIWLWFRISELHDKIDDKETDILELKDSHKADLKEAYLEGLKDGSPIVMSKVEK